MKVATKMLLEEQIAAVVVLGRGEKSDTMWHVPQCFGDGYLLGELVTVSEKDIKYGNFPRWLLYILL